MKSGIAGAQHGLGVVQADAGHPHLARPLLIAATESYRELGDLVSLAHVVHSLGDLELDEGNIPEAAQRYRESLVCPRPRP